MTTVVVVDPTLKRSTPPLFALQEGVGLLVGRTVQSDAYRAVMRIALLLVLLVASVHADPESIEQRVKRQVDRYRAAAGLPEVELDPALGKGCMEHAEYL